MKKKIKCIYIDGMEKSGKTSIARELRKYLKNKNKDLHEIDGVDANKLDKQTVLLSENENCFILKENGLLTLFYNKLKEFYGAKYLSKNYEELIRRENCNNHDYGVVNFFLLPEDQETFEQIWGTENVPNYYNGLVDFYKGINRMSITQGLDIRLIPFDKHDRIFDVRDKILDILEKEYEI